MSLSQLLATANKLTGLKPVAPVIDLSQEGMMAYLKECTPLACKVFQLMEAQEPWVADSASYEVVDCLAELGAQLTKQDIAALAESPPCELPKILGNLRMPRFMMLLDKLMDYGGPKNEYDLLRALGVAASGDPEAVLSFEIVETRLRHLQVTKMLQRMYAPNRANRIIEALAAVSLT